MADEQQYQRWKTKLDAGYGQFRPGVLPQVVVAEFFAIPREVVLRYVRESLMEAVRPPGT